MIGEEIVMTTMTVKPLTTMDDLMTAYDGSYYTIAGAGGDLTKWVEGVEGLLAEKGIGKPVEWVTTTGALVNQFVGADFLTGEGNPFKPDLTLLLFPLEGLDVGKLALFKIQMQDRWFDDVIDNMNGSVTR